MPSIADFSRKLTIKRKPSTRTLSSRNGGRASSSGVDNVSLDESTSSNSSSASESTVTVPARGASGATLLPPGSFDVATAAGAAAMRKTLKHRPSQQRLATILTMDGGIGSPSSESINSSEDSCSTITPGIIVHAPADSSAASRRASVASSTYSMVPDLDAVLRSGMASAGKSGYEAGMFSVDLEEKPLPAWVNEEMQILNKRGLQCFSADDYLEALRA